MWKRSGFFVVIFIGCGILLAACQKMQSSSSSFAVPPSGMARESALNLQGGMTGSGGSLPTDIRNPWFPGPAPVTYCVDWRASDFSTSLEKSRNIVRSAIANWRATLDRLLPSEQNPLIKKQLLTTRLSLNFNEVSCAAGADLVFQLGGEIKTAEYFNPDSEFQVGFAGYRNRRPDGRVEGAVIFLIPDQGPAFELLHWDYPKRFWSLEDRMYNIFVHELGHAMGLSDNAHKDRTDVMSSEYIRFTLGREFETLPSARRLGRSFLYALQNWRWIGTVCGTWRRGSALLRVMPSPEEKELDQLLPPMALIQRPEDFVPGCLRQNHWDPNETDEETWSLQPLQSRYKLFPPLRKKELVRIGNRNLSIIWDEVPKQFWNHGEEFGNFPLRTEFIDVISRRYPDQKDPNLIKYTRHFWIEKSFRRRGHVALPPFIIPIEISSGSRLGEVELTFFLNEQNISMRFQGESFRTYFETERDWKLLSQFFEKGAYDWYTTQWYLSDPE